MIEGIQARKLAIFLAAALILIFTVAAAACSGGSSDTSTPDQTAEEHSSAEDVVEATATEAAEDDDAGSTPADPMDGSSSAPSDSITVEARDNVFDVQPSQGVPGTIKAPANSEFSVKLTNDGTLPHNIAFFTEEGGKVLADGANSNIILEAESTSITFTTPDAGTYFFQCTVHPQEMIGEFIVG